MRSRSRNPLALLGLALLALGLAGCGRASAPVAEAEATAPPAPDPRAQAAAEATAIIQQAQATALVLQAQAQATALVQGALVQQAQAPGSEPAATQAADEVPMVLTAVLPTRLAPQEAPTALPGSPEVAASAGLTGTVELLSVSFGAEGGFVVVNYLAPPAAAQTFWPGMLSVTDEASGTVFEEVPVMPVIGPLIARPIEYGQAGYVMLVHVPPILRPGSLVTVDLAGYKFEHVLVQ